MKEQDQRGEYWLSRLQPGTRVFGADGESIDLPAHLQTLSRQDVARHEMAVSSNWRRVCCCGSRRATTCEQAEPCSEAELQTYGRKLGVVRLAFADDPYSSRPIES